jgi:F-type H+-transporting ATPase subunit delta
MTKMEQVYGGSLYDLAKEEGLTEQIGTELQQVIAIFDGAPDYWRFLQTLSIAKDERCNALDEALKGRIQPYLLNFLKILCENGTMGSLKGCAQEYRRRFNEDNGIVEVCAVTAVELKPALKDALQAKLQSVLGKTVELSCRVDPACMGGVRLDYDGKRIDGTVKNRLDAIKELLTWN